MITPDRVQPPNDKLEKREVVSSAPDHSPLQTSPPRARRRLVWWIAGLIIAAGIVLVAWRLFGPSAPAGSAARHSKGGDQAEPVGVAKVVMGDMQVTLPGLGTVTPLATITVQTQISGQLVSVGYKEGQFVRKGDLLAQIDPRPYQISLEQARGTLAHDTALLGEARSDLARYLILNERNSIAKQQVADQEFLVRQDQGTVIEDRASVASAKLNLAYCRIVSPVTGRVGLRLVDPGNYIQTSSSTGLVVITQMQPISVVFVLPEDEIPNVAAQVFTGHALSVGAYDRTDANLIENGTLLTFDNTVDTTTGTVKLRASFANPRNALFPNEFVNARLLLKTLSNVVKVPTAAVQHGAPGVFVYLAKPNGTVGVQVIKTGVTDGDETQVLSGLKAGDTVVVDGADRLKDGAKIKIMPDSGDQAATNNGPGAPPGEQNHKAGQPSGQEKPPDQQGDQ